MGGFLGNLFSSFGNMGNAIGGGFSNLMNMFGGQGAKQGMSPTQGATQAPGGGGIMGLFGNPMAQGLGLMGAGQLLGGKVKAPNLNTPQVGAYQNFTQAPPQLPQSMQDEINRSLSVKEDYENRNLRDTYKNLRPGTDYTTDSSYQRDLANLQRGQQSDRANAMMGPTLQYLQPMQQSLADQAEMSMYQPMLEYGQKTQQAQNTKNMFGNLGSMEMMNSFFPNMFGGGTNNNSNNGGNWLSRLFGGH